MDSTHYSFFRIIVLLLQLTSGFGLWRLMSDRLKKHPLSPPVHRSLQVVAALLLTMASGLWSFRLMLLPLAGIATFCLVTLLVRQRTQQQQRRLRRSLPHTLDLISLTMLSGHSLHSAILYVTTLPGTGLLGEAFRKTLQQTQRGREWQAALQEMARKLAINEVGIAIDAMLMSHQTGGAIAVTLRDLAQRFNATRMHQAEQHANRLPLFLMAPLFICILPSSFLILFLPLWLRLTRAN